MQIDKYKPVYKEHIDNTNKHNTYITVHMEKDNEDGEWIHVNDFIKYKDRKSILSHTFILKDQED